MTLDVTHEPRFHIVVEGSAWVSLVNEAEPLLLEEGDIAMIPAGEEHWIADDPEASASPARLPARRSKLELPISRDEKRSAD